MTFSGAGRNSRSIQLKELAAEATLKAVWVTDRQWSPLPIEPLVHAKESDMFQGQLPRIHSLGQQLVLANRP